MWTLLAGEPSSFSLNMGQVEASVSARTAIHTIPVPFWQITDCRDAGSHALQSNHARAENHCACLSNLVVVRSSVFIILSCHRRLPLCDWAAFCVVTIASILSNLSHLEAFWMRSYSLPYFAVLFVNPRTWMRPRSAFGFVLFLNVWKICLLNLVLSLRHSVFQPPPIAPWDSSVFFTACLVLWILDCKLFV